MISNHKIAETVRLPHSEPFIIAAVIKKTLLYWNLRTSISMGIVWYRQAEEWSLNRFKDKDDILLLMLAGQLRNKCSKLKGKV
jgi:hypothetical protein